MRSALICHEGDLLNEDGLARWLGSFSSIVLIVRLVEPRSRVFKRLRREVERSGFPRLIDILAFRIAHRLKHGADVRRWTETTLEALRARYTAPVDVQVLECASVNDPRVRETFKRLQVDFALARCKQLIGQNTFSVPPHGVFVLHPGICPEYRNSHGCFWAMAEADYDNVGTTLLKIDAGVDTGPVYAYFRTTFDRHRESPMLIQQRTLFDNLDAARSAMLAVLEGALRPLDTSGRPSRAWGQPWYTAWRRVSR